MDVISEFLTLDNILAVILMAFMFLWHRRATARDSQFFATMQEMIKLLRACGDKLTPPPPRD